LNNNVVLIIAYLHEFHFARLAPKPYDIDQITDPLVGLTVCAYDEDETIANQQERVLYSHLPEELNQQYCNHARKIDCVAMQAKVVAMFSELFSKAGQGIGTWPNSTAYYSVDVIFDAQDMNANDDEKEEAAAMFVPQPKLVEVNFLGDWHGPAAAVGEDVGLYHQWATDIVSTLVNTHTKDLPVERLIKL